MADLTPEQLGALLEEKLRPIHAKLDAALAAPAAHQPSPAATAREPSAAAGAERPRRVASGEGRVRVPFRAVAVLAGVVITALAVLGIGRFILASSGSAAEQAASGSGRLLYSDDFSNVATGLFLGRQDGTASLPGDRASAKWDYAYQDGALVAHVGPPSVPLAGRLIGGSARAANPVLGSFAVEVKARATASPDHAVYGLRYFPGGRDFAFGIRPQDKTFQVWEIFKPPILSASNPVIEPAGADNLLRMEVRGASIRLFVNGQPLRALQDDAFGARPTSVGIFFDTTGSPTDPAVEVRYTEFKIFSLPNT